jgi:thiamine transport system substrate-binding protein
MSKNLLVILLSIFVIAVGGIVFGYFALEGLKVDRQIFVGDKLRVLSYSSFVSSFGPGPELAEKFKAQYGVEVELVNIGDSGLLVQKLKEDASIPVDVVLGLDRLHTKDAAEGLKWRTLPEPLFSNIRPELKQSGETTFIPVMWAPLTFLFKKGTFSTQKTLQDFFASKPDGLISLQDPRLSTPGLQFLYWVTALNIDLGTLKASQFRVSSSWSQSYGLFKRDTAQAVFTYLTSIVFHWDQEKSEDYDYLVTEEGHPYQVEYMAVSDRCRKCDEATKFLEFLLQPENQKLLMEKNYMFPAVTGVEKSGSFARLPELPLLSYEKVQDFMLEKDRRAEQMLKSLQ